MYRQLVAHAKKHPHYNAIIHGFVGAGLGVLATHTVFDPHPLRWGLILLAIGLLGHLYPLMTKN